MSVLLQYLLDALMYTAVGFVVGWVSLLGFNYLFARSLPIGIRTALSRLTWCMASLCLGENRLIQRENNYELRKVVEDKDGEKKLYLGEDEDGEPEFADIDDEGYISRFGLVPFGLTWLPDEHDGLEEIRAKDVEAAAQQQARSDGGIMLMNNQRGGYQEFVPPVDLDEDEVLVSIDKAEEPIRNAAAAQQAHQAEDQTLVKHGGYGDVSNKIIAICGLMSLVFGATMGWVVMGL